MALYLVKLLGAQEMFFVIYGKSLSKSWTIRNISYDPLKIISIS